MIAGLCDCASWLRRVLPSFFSTYRGIIGVISVPKSSLLPTHNKQDFNDLAEYKKLRKCVDQAMTQYNRDFNMCKCV